MAEDNILSFEDQKKKIKERIDTASREMDEVLVDEVKLKEMNDKHAFINSVGGRAMILCYNWSVAANRYIPEFRTPDSIKIQYSNQSVQVNKNYIKLGTWWIENSGRREYDGIMFDPAKPEVWNNLFNLWQGMNIKPEKGNWKCVLNHIYRILCNGDRIKFIYTIKWLAWLIQNPGQRAEVAIIFKGKEGAGKGLIFSQLLKVFAQHGISISNRKHLTGQFNGHLQQCVFLFADEAYYPGDKDVEGCLKQLITEEKIPIESKHMQMALSHNCLHIAMSTNQDWVIPAHEDSRRYFINEVDNRYAKNQVADEVRNTYFDRLWRCMNEGGKEAMVYDLQNMYLGDWHPRKNIPETEEMQKQKILNLPQTELDLLEILDEGIFPGHLDGRKDYRITSIQLNRLLDEKNPGKRKVSTRKKADAIKKLGAKKGHGHIGNFWSFPELIEVRRNWEYYYGRYDWSNSLTEWVVNKTKF